MDNQYINQTDFNNAFPIVDVLYLTPFNEVGRPAALCVVLAWSVANHSTPPPAPSAVPRDRQHDVHELDLRPPAEPVL